MNSFFFNNGTFYLFTYYESLSDYFTSGVTSAQSVFGIIDREPAIDKYDFGGKKLRIVFQD